MIPTLEPKRCRAQTCNKKLHRKKGERLSNWSRRTCCGNACRLVLLHQGLRELDSKKKRISCSGRCGKRLLRSCRMKKAVCSECEDARRQTNATLDRLEKREQVRRYRILMTVLGFEDFDECIAYLKTVPWTDFKEHLVRNLRSAA